MKPNPCLLCGANLNVVGKVHRCVPLQIGTAPTNIDVANEKTSDLANASSMANDANDRLANETPGRNRASSTYRYRNPDKRRLYMRVLMRQRRAAGRAA
jgi:hypothetical protein